MLIWKVIALKRIASLLSAWLIAEGKLGDEQAAVVAYGAMTAVNTVTTTLLLGIAAWVTNLGPLLAVAALTGASLRVLTGGAHYTSPWRCSLASAAAYLGMAFGAMQMGIASPAALGMAGAVVWAAGTVVIWRFAPTDTKAYPLPEAKRQRLRRLSLAYSAFVAILWSVALAQGVNPVLLAAALLAYGWQLFTVTPAGFTVIRTVDQGLLSLGIGGEA
ncbi:MAG TPA: accessory gene regulator B family protein [Symbiobacteriaceae bacterium]|nr:accessory gene regulator B family protein [Symbiobacteriaceae bacterium]